jgi:lipopolysaccharide/colanic/teichoic acid biosynthesis glycosyltransferase
MARRDEKSIGYATCAATAREEVGASPLGRLAKRIFDVVTATICLTLFSPVLLIASIAIKLDSRGPILIRETLYGYKNRTIQVHQFRVVMVCAAGEQIDPPLTPVDLPLKFHPAAIGASAVDTPSGAV